MVMHYILPAVSLMIWIIKLIEQSTQELTNGWVKLHIKMCRAIIYVYVIPFVLLKRELESTK